MRKSIKKGGVEIHSSKKQKSQAHQNDLAIKALFKKINKRIIKKSLNLQFNNFNENPLREDEDIEFINVEFSEYAADCDVALNFEEFCFVAEDDGKIVGVITGRAYYNEVHIGDLIVAKAYRREGVGSKLVEAVENAYKDKGYEKIALTTFGFQAPEFYKKLGYELEFVRKDNDSKLSKYFYLKKI